MLRRTRSVVLLAGGVLGASVAFGATSSPVAADDPPDVVIDDFAAAATVTGVCGSFEETFLPSAGSLGGELDIRVSCGGGAPPDVGQVTVGAGQAVVDAVDGAVTFAELSWDGVDGSSTPVTDGLGGIDLTAGGRKDAFTFVVSTGEGAGGVGPAGDIQMFVAGALGASVLPAPLPLPAGLSSMRVTLPFAAFGGPFPEPADFTAVGSILMTANDAGEAGPLTIGPLETTATVRATMTDTLAIDADGDGRPTVGDTIEYTVTITNGSVLPLPVNGAAFLLPAPDGVLVPGSVISSQGTVVSGNGVGDPGIQVDLDDVTTTTPAEVTFRVVADATGPLANQGVLVYRTTVVTTPLLTTTESDDPDTAAFSDDTITQILPPLTVAIADAPPTGEGAGPATFVASLSGPSPVAVTVDAATLGGTATSGVDFVPRSGTITFAPGEVTAPFAVDLVDDDAIEGPETFTVTLTNPVGAVLGQSSAQATIVDDDDTPPTTPAPTTDGPPSTPAPPDTTLPPPPTSGPIAPTVPPTLPATGSDSSGLAIGALAALGLGFGLTLFGRRTVRDRRLS